MKDILASYLRNCPAEASRLTVLQEFLRDTVDERQLYDRKNFAGHITASGFVLSPDRQSLALVRHKTLNRHLQPGGHVEQSDQNLLAAAVREIEEETGLQNIQHIPSHTDPLIPLDIDTHNIPPNPKKDEPAHWHHDFRYLFLAEKAANPADFFSPDEAEWNWHPVGGKFVQEAFPLVLAKLARR